VNEDVSEGDYFAVVRDSTCRVNPIFASWDSASPMILKLAFNTGSQKRVTLIVRERLAGCEANY
jgi:hypothetical protein